MFSNQFVTLEIAPIRENAYMKQQVELFLSIGATGNEKLFVGIKELNKSKIGELIYTQKQVSVPAEDARAAAQLISQKFIQAAELVETGMTTITVASVIHSFYLIRKHVIF